MIYDIEVNEHPVVVKNSIDESWKTVPEFNITITTNEHCLYIIRYIPDLTSFDDLVKTHYHKIKIPFPTLTESLTKTEKRRSIRNFFHISVKSNAEKVEKYLYRCSNDPVLGTSTLLRDFFSPQREGDEIRHLSHETSAERQQQNEEPSSIADSHESIVDSRIDVGKLVWIPSAHPSEVSLPLNQPQQEFSDDDNDDLIHMVPQSQFNTEYEFPLDHLEMVKVLGKGCMGKVLLVRSKRTKELYALKSIIKEHVIEQREITHTLDERNILTKLSEIDHPYLAKLHCSFQDEHRLYLLTNYYCGGDLATHMAKLYNFPPECALFYAAEIIDGISELHRLGVLYRDLKPENILLTMDGHIILTDFGLSKWLEESDGFSTQTFCGTAEYLAPEVLLGESYSFGIDHWSFGTILYEMLAGITPFWADNHADMYRRVLEDPLEFPADIFDYETAEFLSDILDRDPRTRLGANNVQEIKDHVYFADISWDDIKQRRLQPPYLPPVKDALDFTNFDPDFLAMSPALTPAASQVEFADEYNDIFDGYSFTDERYIEAEQLPMKQYHRQSHHEDGFYQDREEENDEVIDEHESPLLFQPARKRGSISMLSNVDSFCLDGDTNKPTFGNPVTNSFKDEELARYAKRRNTSASEDNHEQQPIKPTLVVMNYNETLSSFDDLEFSQLPDLRLSFNIDRDDKTSKQKLPASTKSSHKTTASSSKTRRFLSLLL